MALPRYGVAIGTFQSFTRDPTHDFGHWYHGHLALSTPQGIYQTALDVDAPDSVGVSYRVVDDLRTIDITGVRALADGFHPLASTPSSGALDYIRSPMLRDPDWLTRLKALLRRLLALWRRPAPGDPVFGPSGADRLAARLGRADAFRLFPWTASDGDNALDVLDPHVRAATRIYVFGQSFATGLGVHDVHLNQGDPAGSQWWDTDGIWQDGAVVCEHPDGRVVVWQIRFNTQSLTTDNDGHPL
ncbi:DUF2278 family protein [Kitasatospora paracochleata]|uniref:DUF2278 family protein n=1 Tax=Kitasatospora paracochleata TaxID=58354 RepID=A0ABT1IPX0_9ACTN|nr:DUF2278 family protein [Kitasatospora paracochleata]MCP2307178.1 hypothetical protein [Kitasatospora paracochleata]